MKNKKVYIILAILFITAGNIFQINAQHIEEEIDEIVSKQYKPNEPGAAVLVAKEGKIIYDKGFGTANMELNIPINTKMVFEIGSITKQFTAVSVLMLVEDGKLSLEDDITKFIKDYPTHGHKITVHHLLTHTSGIKSYTGIDSLMKLARNDFKPVEMIDLIKNFPMDFSPGEKYLYNNSAYFILGYIIEEASGLSYAQFLEENIFKPLKMNDSYYGSMKKIIKNRASGYQKREKFENAEYISLTIPYAAGSIMSTVHDLFIWNRAVKAYKLISKASTDLAFTNYKLNNGENINYGYGWALGNIKGSKMIEHGGGIFGYTTAGIWMPDEDVFVAVFTNRDDIGPQNIATKIAALVINKPFPKPNPNIKIDEKYAENIIGVYEFEDDAIRYITYENGQLFSQRKNGVMFKILPVEENFFMYENSMSTIRFMKKNKDKIEAEFEGNTKSKGVKTNKPIPVKESISVDDIILKSYVGEYEIQPGFSIKIFTENGKFYGQATGQDKFELFAESETKFFLKVVDAKIEFFKDEKANVSHLILYQGGQEIKGQKK